MNSPQLGSATTVSVLDLITCSVAKQILFMKKGGGRVARGKRQVVQTKGFRKVGKMDILTAMQESMCLKTS